MAFLVFLAPARRRALTLRDTNYFLLRPYYEALEVMCVAQAECQKAAVQFQRAAGNCSIIENFQWK